MASIEAQLRLSLGHDQRRGHSEQLDRIATQSFCSHSNDFALVRAGHESQLELHARARRRGNDLHDQNLVTSVSEPDHPESLANKGFFVEPKMKGLLVQGKCLTFTPKTSFIAGNFPDSQEVAVNRSELVDSVSSQTGLDKRHAEGAVMAFIDSVIAEARSGSRVSIFGFGTFTPTSRAARTGRNPQTGAPVKIAASKSVRFAPAAAFKSALNSKGPVKKAAAKAPAKKGASAKKSGVTRSASAKKSAKKASKSAKK